jgi:mono/diheme cytochrome c family protein
VLAALGGCAIKHPTADLVRGKVLFVQKCGACHTLAHANTTGTIGPNLDDAFHQDRIDGVKSTSIEGLVDYWIRYPNTEGAMPPMLYKGQDAQDVGAYVGLVAARSGVDTGALAAAGGVTGTTPAAGKEVFTGIGGCGSCHTLTAAGTSGTVGPNLNALKAACAAPRSKQIRGPTLRDCIETAITDPYKYIPPGYSAGVMPSDFKTRLTESEITALVNFLSSTAR